MLMAIILFIMIFKTIMTFCPCFIFITDPSLKDAVYVLFREVVIVICGAIIIEALTYYKVLKLGIDRSIGIIYCILFALVVWTLLGFVMIFRAQ
jgi:hypothetical protein